MYVITPKFAEDYIVRMGGRVYIGLETNYT